MDLSNSINTILKNVCSIASEESKDKLPSLRRRLEDIHQDSVNRGIGLQGLTLQKIVEECNNFLVQEFNSIWIRIEKAILNNPRYIPNLESIINENFLAIAPQTNEVISYFDQMPENTAQPALTSTIKTLHDQISNKRNWLIKEKAEETRQLVDRVHYEYTNQQENEFNISLAHIDSHLDLHTKKNVLNINHVLQKAILCKDEQDQLINLLNNTSFLYIKRLEEDGLITGLKASKDFQITSAQVTDKAIRFYSCGGYIALVPKEHAGSSQKLNSSVQTISDHLDIQLSYAVKKFEESTHAEAQIIAVQNLNSSSQYIPGLIIEYYERKYCQLAQLILEQTATVLNFKESYSEELIQQIMLKVDYYLNEWEEKAIRAVKQMSIIAINGKERFLTNLRNEKIHLSKKLRLDIAQIITSMKKQMQNPNVIINNGSNNNIVQGNYNTQSSSYPAFPTTSQEVKNDTQFTPHSTSSIIKKIYDVFNNATVASIIGPIVVMFILAAIYWYFPKLQNTLQSNIETTTNQSSNKTSSLGQKTGLKSDR